MSIERQVEEMAKILCGMKNGCDGCMWDKVHCNERNYAEEIYNAGYRKQEWVSVAERLPEECTHVIVHDEDGTVGEAFHLISDHFEWVANGKIAFVTHWMHLPEPPKGE